MAKINVPFLVKHVALAIYESGDVHGSSPTQKITGAMDIARHRLVEYGFLRKGSETGPVDNIKLTVKGMRGEQRHKYHGPRAKNEKFDKLYELIAEVDQTDEEDAEGIDPMLAEENSPADRKKVRQARHAAAARSAAGPRKSPRVPKRVKKAKAAQAKRARRR